MNISRLLTREFYQKDTNLYTIALLLLPMHVLGVYALFHISSTALWTLLAGYFLISGLGVAVAYHRYYSHKAFKTSKFWRVVMTYFGVLSCQGSPLFWASVHKSIHHPHSDTPKDLHSPTNGIFRSYIGWILFLVPKNVKLRGISDLIRDPVCMWFHKHYYQVVWASWLVLGLIDVNVLLGVALAQLYAFHQENIVDVICHLKPLGYRNYETRDNSVNIWPLGYLFWGQAWHNNHHGKPADYDFGEKWWEFDPAKVWVNLIKTS